MKKLMFVAAVTLCGAVFADGAIESSNIVGYMNNGGTVAGLNLVGPGFQDVGYNSLKLTGVKVSNAEGGEVGTGACIIDVIDENGNPVKTYSWMSSGRGATKTWGWKDGGADIEDTVVFGRGVGMLFTAQNEGDQVQSSGQVDLSALTIGETVAGLNVIANPYPTTVKLNTVTVTNADGGEVGTGACIIDIIDENGTPVTTYSWMSSGRGATKTWGWKVSGADIDDSVVLKAGQAILFTAQNAGDKIIFPAL